MIKIKSDKNKNGDIEIVYTGLRPGEKLFEELLIDTESVPTKNPLIFTAKENFLNYSKLIPELEVLKQHLKQNDQSGSLKILSKLVPEWKINKNLFEVSK